MQGDSSAVPVRSWREIAYELIKEKDRSKVLTLMSELSLAFGDQGAEDGESGQQIPRDASSVAIENTPTDGDKRAA